MKRQQAACFFATVLLQPFSQKSRTATVPKVFQIGLCGVVEADLELFWNSWSAGILGERLYTAVSASPVLCLGPSMHVRELNLHCNWPSQSPEQRPYRRRPRPARPQPSPAAPVIFIHIYVHALRGCHRRCFGKPGRRVQEHGGWLERWSPGLLALISLSLRLAPRTSRRVISPLFTFVRWFAGIAVSPILADPDENNCAEQMHGSHPLGRIRALGQSAVVRTAGCSCCDRPELRRLQ